jgi:hypothetical protein
LNADRETGDGDGDGDGDGECSGGTQVEADCALAAKDM